MSGVIIRAICNLSRIARERAKASPTVSPNPSITLGSSVTLIYKVSI